MFLISVLIPGLFLGYLSLKTIEHEKALILSSIETHREEFLDYVEKTLQKAETAYIKEIQELLIRSSASASSKNYFFLATNLLKSPLIQCVVVLEKDKLVLPKKANGDWINRDTEHTGHKPESKAFHDLIIKIQFHYKRKNYAECLRYIRRYMEKPEYKFRTGLLGTHFYYGFKLMEIQCYRFLNMERKIIDHGREMIDELLEFEHASDYGQWQYYLNETLSSLSSLEDLPSDMRDNIWDISLRTNSFFLNADLVHNSWGPEVDFLAQINGKDYTEGLQVFYMEGNPFLKIRFPWIDSRTQVIAKLNDSILVGLVRAETIGSPKGPWKNIEYAIYNLNNLLIDAPLGIEGKTLAIERILNSFIPQWKIAIFKKDDDQRLAVGKRKIVVLYILLCFSGFVLIMGTFSTVKGVINENRMVRMKSNFLSAVTHELKTPLTSIRILSELVGSGRQVDDRKIKKYANMIGLETQRLQVMIENILNSARLDAKDLQITLTPVDLNELIHEIAALMKSAFEKQKVRLRLKLDKDAVILGDREALRSVIQNLLDNALKYSRPDTRADVILEKSEKMVLLIVRDQGKGIPQHALKYVFQKFYRAEDEMTRKTKGTGIGLALVKQILDQHNAKISVKSKIDSGTEFRILFPEEKNG
jgi:signal transduction histidine kinase